MCYHKYMKRVFYIASFTLLGLLLQFIAHALIEMWYIGMLLSDFPKYGLGLSWNTWVLMHNILSVIFFIAGSWIGYKEGVYWWRKIYIEKALERWRERYHERKIPIGWLIGAGVFIIVFSSLWILAEEAGWIQKPGEPRACTLEAKECPGGVYVGRNGPNCEFTACPELYKQESNVEPRTFDISGWQTYRNEKYGFEVKYPEDWYIQNDMTTILPELTIASKPKSKNAEGIGRPAGGMWLDIWQTTCDMETNGFIFSRLEPGQNGIWYKIICKEDIQIDLGHSPMGGKQIRDYEILLGQILSTFKFIK